MARICVCPVSPDCQVVLWDHWTSTVLVPGPAWPAQHWRLLGFRFCQPGRQNVYPSSLGSGFFFLWLPLPFSMYSHACDNQVPFCDLPFLSFAHFSKLLSVFWSLIFKGSLYFLNITFLLFSPTSFSKHFKPTKTLHEYHNRFASC